MDRRTTSAFVGASALLDHGVRERLRLSWRLLRDERVSSFKYALPALISLYVLSPVDPIPDFLLGLGQMDDLGVVIGGILLLGRLIPMMAPAEVVDEHLRDMHNQGRTDYRHNGADDDIIDARFNVRR
jgi:uncharacterized membrane protein YkvA (DUF1232 family)